MLEPIDFWGSTIVQSNFLIGPKWGYETGIKGLLGGDNPSPVRKVPDLKESINSG